MRTANLAAKRVLSVLLFVGLTGCSVVFDPGAHQMGGVDAGPPDTGVDAGPVDAGPVDAGPVDAGPVDAGPVDAGPVDAGPVAVSAIQFCPEYVAHYCAARVACCVSAESVDACASRVITRCNETIGPFANDTRNAYQPERAGQLMADIDAAAATCDERVLDLFRIEGLQRVLAGTIPVGEGCGGDTVFACNEPNHCTRDNLVQWTCRADPAEDGERCFLDTECADGLRCNRVSIGMEVCAPLLADAEPCRRSDECVSLRCSESESSPGCVPATTQRIYCPSPFEDTIGEY